MKRSGMLVAAAASATAVSTAVSYDLSTSQIQSSPPQNEDVCERKNGTEKKKKNCADKFTPRFDGLRFIETLVTAHR